MVLQSLKYIVVEIPITFMTSRTNFYIEYRSNIHWNYMNSTLLIAHGHVFFSDTLKYFVRM